MQLLPMDSTLPVHPGRGFRHIPSPGQLAKDISEFPRVLTRSYSSIASHAGLASIVLTTVVISACGPKPTYQLRRPMSASGDCADVPLYPLITLS